MPFHLEIDTAAGMVVLKTHGDLVAGEFEDMISQSREACRAGGWSRVLVDHSLSTVHRISEEEVIFIAGLCEALNDVLAGGRLAVVLVQDVDYGLGRMWLTYTTDRLTYESRIFRAAGEALDWLGSG